MDYGIGREAMMKRECIVGVTGEVSEYCWDGSEGADRGIKIDRTMTHREYGLAKEGT